MAKRKISLEHKEKLAASRRAYFDSLTPEQRKAHFDKAGEARRRAAEARKSRIKPTSKITDFERDTIRAVVETALDIKNGRKVRTEVAAFSEKMEQKLKKRDGYGGWRHLPLEYLLKKLSGEMNELMTSIQYESAEEVMDECVDVANYAMFLWDVMRHKDPRPKTDLIRRSKESGR